MAIHAPSRPDPHLDIPTEFAGIFRTDFLARSLYAEGAGIARCLPVAVAVPRDVADVSALVRWARRNGHSLIPRGSGSGMAAGAVGPDVIVDLSRFSHIGAVDASRRSMRVGVGALRGAVDAAARRVGLQFPVDPSSGAFCTIGGMTATNAAGARTLRYGAMRAWVTGLRCVFDDGTDQWIRRDNVPPRSVPAVARLLDTLELLRGRVSPALLAHAVRKESSGYAIAAALGPSGHLLDLLVGSEGTLALFVEVELALAPVPGATVTIMSTYATLDDAVACAADMRDDGASACELLDRTFLDVAARHGPTGVPDGAEAVLLTEVEGHDTGHARDLGIALAERSRRHRARSVTTSLDTSQERKLWELRHAASPVLARLAPRLRSMQFIEDGCVPPSRFADYVRGVRTVLIRSGMLGVIFGHAGDAHAHVNPLVDVTVPDWRARVQDALADVCALTAQLGGTLAGEHGDGRLRAPLWHHVWPIEARAAFANIKAAADPSGVFNVGCKVAHADTDTLGDIRYDSDAPPLDPRARIALDAIERERAWHRFRLDGVDPSDAL